VGVSGEGWAGLWLQKQYDHDLHLEWVVWVGLTWLTTVEVEVKVGWVGEETAKGLVLKLCRGEIMVGWWRS